MHMLFIILQYIPPSRNQENEDTQKFTTVGPYYEVFLGNK